MQRAGTTIVVALVAACCSAPRPAPAPGAAVTDRHRPSGHAQHRQQRHAHQHGQQHGGHTSAGAHAFTDAAAWTNVFDDPTRDAWQRPDLVLQALDLLPTTRVADVGAGTGYFAVRLARAVPAGEVIATDIEPDMVRHLTERAAREQLPNLRALAATTSTSGLDPASVDRILVVHVWHHLDDRLAYARDLLRALRADGKLVIVEFGATAERGPPAHLRLAPEAIIAELHAAGFVARLSTTSLPDQFIVEATRAR